MLIQLSHPGSAFLLRECRMARSKVYVTSRLCNSRQNINHLCVLLGTAWHGWSPSSLTGGRLCCIVTSSSHRTWPAICPGGVCLLPSELHKFLLGFSVLRQKSVKGSPMALPRQMSLADNMSWGGMVGSPLDGGFQRWGHGKLFRGGQKGAEQELWSSYL